MSVFYQQNNVFSLKYRTSEINSIGPIEIRLKVLYSINKHLKNVP